MLQQTDILVCLIPLTKKTKYLLNYKTLSYLKKARVLLTLQEAQSLMQTI
jgi:phosphoglycerate dehydrogenase-like enzyme